MNIKHNIGALGKFEFTMRVPSRGRHIMFLTRQKMEYREIF